VATNPSPGSGGLTEYVTGLLRFLDTCQWLAPVSLVPQVERLRSEVLSQQQNPVADRLADIANRINSMIPLINQSKQASNRDNFGELWIDVGSITSSAERKRVVELMFSERHKKGYVSSESLLAGEDAVNIPTLFTLSSRWASKGDRLRVFKDSRTNRVKLVVVCGYKRSKIGPFMFSFTCDSSSRSIGLLADNRRHNTLADAVLKATCESKEFSRRLILDPQGREDRCFVSRWSKLANGIAGRKSHRKSIDRVLDMLVKGEDCFATDESRIQIDCLKQAKRRRKSKKP
jgi:hypothetical protein